MTNNTLNGWVLSKKDSGDTSLRVVFFTRENGLVHCLCKGWRNSKKRIQLQPFIPMWLSLNEKNGWYYAQSIEHSGPSFPLSGQTLFSALYLNELIFYSLKPLDPYPELFDAYQQTLRSLLDVSDKYDLEAKLRRFEWFLLATSGQGISLTEEAGTGRFIEEDKYYQYYPDEGFRIADNGISGKYITAMASDNFSDKETLKVAKYVTRKAINHLLDGREIKARALFKV